MNWLSLKVARKYIFSKKSYSAVNLISIVAICGLVITTTALVCVLSVFNGFASLVESKLATIDPELRVESVMGKTINNADSLISIVSKVEGVELAIPTIQDHALAMCNNRQMPVSVKGIPTEFDSISNIRDLIKEDGSYMLSDDVLKYSIVSVGVAISLDSHPGYDSQFQLYAPKRQGEVDITNPMGAFRSDSLYISGVFQVNHPSYDNNTVFIPISVARHLFDYDTQSTDIEISVLKGYDTENVREAIQQKIGDKYVVKNRLMQQESSFKMINIEKWITFLLLGFIMLIATFNVISTVSVLIVEKKNDISTMRNLGASKRLVTRIFTTQTWLITLFGTALGIIVGITLCICQEQFGWIKLAGDTRNLIIRAYPVAVQFSDILIVLLLAIIISIFSSFATAAVMHSRLRQK